MDIPPSSLLNQKFHSHGFLLSFVLKCWLDQKRNLHLRRLIQYLAQNAEKGMMIVTFRQIHDHLNSIKEIKPQNLSYHLEKMIDGGMLIRLKRNRYQIPPHLVVAESILEYLDQIDYVTRVLGRSIIEHVPVELLQALMTEPIQVHRERSLLFDFVRDYIITARRDLKVLAPSTYLAVHPSFEKAVLRLLDRGVNCSIILTREPVEMEQGKNAELEKKGVRIYHAWKAVTSSPSLGSLTPNKDNIRVVPSMFFVLVDEISACFSFLAKNREVPCHYLFLTESPKILTILYELYYGVISDD